MFDNITAIPDAYKHSHHKMTPPDLEYMYSKMVAREGGPTLFFGLQYQVIRYLAGQQVTWPKIQSGERRISNMMGPGVYNTEGWKHILFQHDGMLPLSIRALEEGVAQVAGNAFLSVENTCPQCAWLVTFIDSLLLQLWSPIEVATYSHECASIIWDALEQSGTPELLPSRLHDFGFRGTSSVESAAIQGAAHLVNFAGSDTVVAQELLEDFYNDYSAAKTIPAGEHSVVIAWGQTMELEAYRHILQQFPDGLVACPIDSYDADYAVRRLFGVDLFETIMERNGMFVGRPDSGSPEANVVKVTRDFENKFGGVQNAKGYNLLDPHVAVIQGDGMDKDTLGNCEEALMDAGYSADVLAFGMGGKLLNAHGRDDHSMAMKPSVVRRTGGREYDVFKTTPGKPSTGGKVFLPREVMRDGRLTNTMDFTQVRGNARAWL